MIRAAQLIPSLIIRDQDKKIGSLGFMVFCGRVTTRQADNGSGTNQNIDAEV
jgi:hypothetical protein